MADIPIRYTTHYNLPLWADGAHPGGEALNKTLEDIDKNIYSASFGGKTIDSNTELQVKRLGVGVPTSSIFTVDVSGSQHISGSLYVEGDIHLRGYVAQDNFTEMTIKDHSIVLNRSGSNVSAVGSGIIVEGDNFTTASSIIYDGTNWNYDKSQIINTSASAEILTLQSSNPQIKFNETIYNRTTSIGLSSGNLVISAPVGGVVKFTGNFQPATDNYHNIGHSSYKWKDLYLSGDIYTGQNIYLRNKGNTAWLSFVTRNTSGSDAVYDLSNIGTISLLRNTNDYGWSLWTDSSNYLRLTSGTSTNTTANTWLKIQDNNGNATFTGNLIVSGTSYNTFRNYLNIGDIGYNGAIYLKRSTDGQSNVSLYSVSGSGFNIVQSGGRTSKQLMDGNGISFQTEDATSPYTVNTRLQILHGDNASVYVVNKLGVGTNNPQTGIHQMSSGDVWLRQSRANGAYYWDLGFDSNSNYQFKSQTSGVVMELGYSGGIKLNYDSTSYPNDWNFTIDHYGQGGGQDNLGGAQLLVQRGYATNGKGLFTVVEKIGTGTPNTRFVVTDGGNVGIGTTTPSKKLYVSNGSIGLDNNQWITFKNPTATNDDGIINYDTSSNLTINRGNDLYIKQSGTTQLTVNQAGNVGIGTSNPTAGKVVIINPSTSNQGAFVVDQLHASAEIIDIRKSGTSVIRVQNNGNLGIGATTTPEKLTLNGNMKIFGDIYSDNWNGADPYTGYYIGKQGSVFNKITSNEMHVKSFIADLEMALAGSQIIAKSVAKLYSDFTVGGTLIVEEISGFTGHVFEDGDYIRLRNQSRTNGGIDVVDIWGTVTFVSRDDTTKTQTYSFSKLAGSGTSAIKGTLALDYGTSGNGIYETVAQGPLGKIPYSQVATFNTNPWTDMKIISRFGGLSGVTDSVLGSLSGYGLYTQKLYLSSMGNSSNAITMIADTNTARLSLQTGGNTIFDFNTATSTAKIASWTIDANKLYNSTDIVLDASNKKVSIYNDAVKMYYNSYSDYGIKDSAGKFQLGSTNKISNWTFDNDKLYNNTDIVLDGTNKKVAVYNDAVKMYYTSTGDYGIKDSAGKFQLGSINKIANWTFDTNKLYNSTDIILDGTTKKISVNNDAVKMYYTSTGDYGIKDTAGKFQLGSSNQIAGWTFDTNTISKTNGYNNIVLDSANPYILTGYGLDMFNDGHYILMGKIPTGHVYAGENGLISRDAYNNKNYFILTNSTKKIANWTFDDTKLYNGTDIVLDATNKKVSVYNDTVKMYYTNTSDYGIKDSAGKFQLGSINKIAGFTFDNNKLYNSTNIILDGVSNKVSVNNDTVKMYYTNASDYGLKDSSGNFSLGSTNQIAGWTFDTSTLSKQSGTGKVFLSGNDISVGLQIDLAYGSSGTAGTAKWLSAGKIRGTDGTSDYQSSYGFSIVDGFWNSLLELSDTRSSIANWTFDTTKLTSGTSTAGLSLNTSNIAFITSKGFEVYDTSNPKMFIGDKSGHFMDWNVSTANKLTIKGDLKASRLSTTANYGGTDTGAFIYDTTIRSQYVNGGITYDCKMADGSFNVYSNVNGTVTEVSINGTDVTIGGYKAKRTLGSMTGTQIGVLTGLRDGDEVYNTSIQAVQFWYNGAWR